MIRKTPEQSAPAFFDEQTKKFTSFEKIINSFKPLSIFAKKDFLHLQPLNEEELKTNYDFLKKVEKCEKSRNKIEHILSDFHEISASLQSLERGTSTSVDIFEIKRFIHHHKILKELTDNCLEGYFASLQDIWEILDPQNSASYAFAPFNETIEKLTKKCVKLQSKIGALYEIQAEKVEKAFGIKVKDRKFILKRRKSKEILSSDLVMVEREGIQSYTFVLRPTDEILSLERELSDCENALKIAQDKEVKRLCDTLSQHVERLKEEKRKISEFDLSLAKLRGLKWGWIYPKFDSKMDIRFAFHPEIKHSVEEMEYTYTPLNGVFEKGLTMIFGPNMGGKTTTLKTIGLLCALASYGFLVPAKSVVLPHIKWIRYIGSDEGNNGLSKFAKQMDSMAKTISFPQNGLILIDEFGAGTNPYEGEALATALAKELNRRNDFSIMVTHYRKTIEDVKCKKYTMGRINFENEITSENVYSKIDHHLIDGAKVELGDAIKIAKILGLPDSVIEVAKRLLE